MIHEAVRKAIKLKSPKCYCPKCEQERLVLTRGGHQFAYHASLECGHTVLIIRETKGKKFWWWRLIAKEPVITTA